MAAINFNQKFIDAVLSGDKPCTTRKTKRCKVGDTIQIYTGQRTKNCQKHGEATCTGIGRILISKNGAWYFYTIDGETFTERDGKPFYQLEGFANHMCMVDFFKDHYGLPFEGYVHYFKLN